MQCAKWSHTQIDTQNYPQKYENISTQRKIQEYKVQLPGQDVQLPQTNNNTGIEKYNPRKHKSRNTKYNCQGRMHICHKQVKKTGIGIYNPRKYKYRNTKYNCLGRMHNSRTASSHFRFCGPFVRTLCPPKQQINLISKQWATFHLDLNLKFKTVNSIDFPAIQNSKLT